MIQVPPADMADEDMDQDPSSRKNDIDIDNETAMNPDAERVIEEAEVVDPAQHDDESMAADPAAEADPGPAAPAPDVAMAEEAVVPAAGVAEDLAGPLADAEPAAAAGEPADVRAGRGGGGAKVHYSPKDLFEMISPNSSFGLGINYNDHRFWCKCKVKDEKFIEPYHRQSFSKVFHLNVEGSWQSAIKEVHEYTWNKWSLVREKYPANKALQNPGEIPAEVMDGLKEEMAKMPEPKEYKKA